MLEAFNERKNIAMPDYPYMDKYRKNLSNPPHFHDDMEIIAVLSGSVTVYFSGGTVQANAGDIAVLMPKEIHHFSTEVENSVYVIKLYCKNSVDLTDLSNYCFLGCLIKSGTELNRKLFSHINELANEYEQDTNGLVYDGLTKGSAYAANAHANMILSLILRSDKCVLKDNDLAQLNKASIMLLRKVTEYINAHYREQISLECIANYCNMSKFYFSHTFKRAMGMTFLEYLTSYRTNIAKRLLSQTDKTVTEISCLSGFSSTRMFNHLFKTRLGISPTEYRKKIRSQLDS